jgi:hypothetical protein
MSDQSGDPPPGPDQAREPAGDPPPQADRRSFLRQLSTDAVWTAGKVAGASAALRRSLVAVGETALGTFEVAEGPAMAAEPSVAAPVPEAASGSASAAPAVTPTPIPARDPVAALTPEQHGFLSNGRRAALAVNDPAGPPLLAFSTYHWDGSLLRLPARDFSARTIDIDLDQRVTLLVDDPASDAWVAINGIATLGYGDRVEPEMRLILAKYHDADQVTSRWDELRSTGDQVVIRIRPTRFVWRLLAP